MTNSSKHCNYALRRTNLGRRRLDFSRVLSHRGGTELGKGGRKRETGKKSTDRPGKGTRCRNFYVQLDRTISGLDVEGLLQNVTTWAPIICRPFARSVGSIGAAEPARLLMSTETEASMAPLGELAFLESGAVASYL